MVIYSNAPTVKLYRNGTLIGTATRKTNTSAAGHTYYTYTTTSNSSSVCTAVNASGSASLYATFNVTYASGTISAKAYNANGTEITASCAGNTSVSTPGSVSKLNVSKDKAEIVADGGSLSYITVDVTDANGVLDTTATNLISFSLSGNGEIVGVDNGDQATTAKYQQPGVLTSSSSAKISAYAGKALVIGPLDKGRRKLYTDRFRQRLVRRKCDGYHDGGSGCAEAGRPYKLCFCPGLQRKSGQCPDPQH